MSNLCGEYPLVAVWGCGYIGFSNLIFYGKNNIECIGIDPDTSIIDKILRGNYKKDLDDWLNIDYRELFSDGRIRIIKDINGLPESRSIAHIICVPTEKNGEPDMSILFDVVCDIAEWENRRNNKHTAVLVESTMIPGTADLLIKKLEGLLIGKELLFAVSPRRDWFLNSNMNLSTLPRILGANSEQSMCFFEELLGTVCKKIICASSCTVAEMTKSVENAFRHMDITLANQLSDAFPSCNIREVLELAGTKWNMNTYYPSFGVGGYCIPLASRYLICGAQNKSGKDIPLLTETVDYDNVRSVNVLEQTGLLADASVIGIFGVTYKANTSVVKHSPMIEIARCLKALGKRVLLCDPKLSVDVIRSETGCEVFSLSDSGIIASMDAVILGVSHKEFRDLDHYLTPILNKRCIIYDTTECTLKNWPKDRYRLIGTPSWFCNNQLEG